MRDAYLIRTTRDLKATIFFDAMDLWKKAEKAGSEDFLLQRYERGAFIARVLYPDRGAHKDTQYFDIFGATFIATNEPVHPALESRAVLISMKEATKEFGEIPLDLARALKERLIAFRARHLGEELPQADKPAKGRLGDILKPLMQMILLVDPGYKENFHKLIEELDQERKAQKSDTSDARLISTVAELKTEARDGLLSIQSILTRYNEGTDEKYKTSNQRLGWKLKALGFTKRRLKAGMYIELDSGLLERMLMKFGLKEKEDTSTDTPSENLHHLHHLHPTNNDGHFRGEDVDVDVEERQTSTPNLHPRNPYKQRVNVDNVEDVDVSNGTKEVKKPQPDYKINEIAESTGDIVYQLVRLDKDGKPLISIITPNLPEYKDVRREYEQQQSI